MRAATVVRLSLASLRRTLWLPLSLSLRWVPRSRELSQQQLLHLPLSKTSTWERPHRMPHLVKETQRWPNNATLGEVTSSSSSNTTRRTSLAKAVGLPLEATLTWEGTSSCTKAHSNPIGTQEGPVATSVANRASTSSSNSCTRRRRSLENSHSRWLWCKQLRLLAFSSRMRHLPSRQPLPHP